MGLCFYPKKIGLPSDHPAHDMISGIPDRFVKHKFKKDWIIEGPFLDPEDETYVFMLTARDSPVREQYMVTEEAMLYRPAELDRAISKMIARCMEEELNLPTASAGMGKDVKAEDNEEPEVCVIDDYIRGTGEVDHRQATRPDGDETSPDKSGGLIIKSR